MIQNEATKEQVISEFEHEGYTRIKAIEYYQKANEWVAEAKESPEASKRLQDSLKQTHEPQQKGKPFPDYGPPQRTEKK